MLDDATYSTSHGAVRVQMAVNLESDGSRLLQETAEQRQKRTQNGRERATQRRAEETLEPRERRLKGKKKREKRKDYHKKHLNNISSLLVRLCCAEYNH
jgi:hypothetical protein